VKSRGAPAKRPVRVALLSGACVRYDAISYSMWLKLELLRSLRDAGYPVDVRAFVQGTDLDDPDIRVRSLRDLVLDPDFSSSDVVVYEYGIAYELFDSLFLLRDHQRSVGIYHNLTPLEFVQWPAGRKGVRDGVLRRQNLARLDHVACDSEFNRQDLVDCGLPEERLSVLSLPPRVSLPGANSVDWSADPVELLFVGRLVKAKGVHDLLEAVRLLGAEGESGFRLTLAGSVRWSEADTIELARKAAADSRTGAIRITVDPDDAKLERLYRDSSVFVMPSYHEGYCLPVLEAFHARCQVVASDAGNLPEIVCGLGQHVEAGNVPALAKALRRAIEGARAVRADQGAERVPTAGGELALDEWIEAVERHVERHSRERYVQEFLRILRGVGDELATAPALVGVT
jgi:glycosyltransferase involved in cell wall biosynthesis